jgi:signal transduction histidine kinase
VEDIRAQRLWLLTVRRFAEVAWARHGLVRYSSVTLVPIVVALTTPGFWWIACAVGAAVGIVIDQRTHAAFQRLSSQLEEMDADILKRVMGRHIAALSVITLAYVTPYVALAFAPQPGPLVGFLYCAGAALVCACLHVMTRTMVFYTIPLPVLGLVANAYALADGSSALLIAGLAGVLGLNAITMARAGAGSFDDLIRARYRAEEAAETLEERVRERTRQLAVATRRAQQANTAKSVFLANMSHELRTPLNAVIGYAEIVEEDLASGDIRRSAADLGRIRSSAMHLLRLINEVLDLSRIEAGKLDLHLDNVELAPLLREAVDTVMPIATKNNTRCGLILDESLSHVRADETRLRQCVLNLLSNAAKFTLNGTITLQARACMIGSAPGVAISVRDTGPGIPSEDLMRLFQPFVQADNSKTRAHEGAGLGLAITRRLARAMGGDVAAYSKLGEGSVFTLFVPAGVAAKQAAAA